MKYHLIYIFYIFFFTLSSIGAGLIFSNYINPQFKKLNFGYQGIIGIFFITFISIITSFFLKHGYFHNIILHFTCFFFLVREIFKNNIRIKELKNIFYLVFIFLIGIYVYKNHDDFPYYHLTYALNLSENSVTLGQGLFSHGFRTYSSIFYFHSTLYLPLINFYSFHMGPFLVLIFFNYILLKKIFIFSSSNEKNLNFYFCILCLAFVNVIFYRLGEHGTDRSAQIMILLIFIHLIDILLENKNKKDFNFDINLILLFITFAISLKSTYAIYSILIFFLLFQKNKMLAYYFKSLNFRFISILAIAFSMNFFINFLNTGCLLYPEEKTCVGNFDWSIPKSEVKKMKTHYEWWAKAGGGPSYKSNLSKEEYIKKFNWLKPWFERHFFTKITDTLFGLMSISLILFLLIFFFRKKEKNSKNKNFKFLNKLYFLIFIIFLVWFLKHPSMRYGGYVLFALPIFLFVSNFLCKFNYTVKDKKKITFIFIILIFITYNLRNVVRLNKEINFYNYPIIQSPYFFVENVESEAIIEDKNFNIYAPKNGKMCWASKTPCSYNRNIKVKKLLNFYIVMRNDK